MVLQQRTNHDSISCKESCTFLFPGVASGKCAYVQRCVQTLIQPCKHLFSRDDLYMCSWFQGTHDATSVSCASLCNGKVTTPVRSPNMPWLGLPRATGVVESVCVSATVGHFRVASSHAATEIVYAQSRCSMVNQGWPCRAVTDAFRKDFKRLECRSYGDL